MGFIFQVYLTSLLLAFEKVLQPQRTFPPATFSSSSPTAKKTMSPLQVVMSIVKRFVPLMAMDLELSNSLVACIQKHSDEPSKKPLRKKMPESLENQLVLGMMNGVMERL